MDFHLLTDLTAHTSKSFQLCYVFFFVQSKTFTLVCNPHETIARARAQLLHILYELGRAEHQFRFRFKGEYLRDGYTFEVINQEKLAIG